jgi:6-phosphogluconolactonase (cycloisomerase 2 family)
MNVSQVTTGPISQTTIPGLLVTGLAGSSTISAALGGVSGTAAVSVAKGPDLAFVLQQAPTSSLTVFTSDDGTGALIEVSAVDSLSNLTGSQNAIAADVIPSGFYAGGVLFFLNQGTQEVGSVGAVDRSTGMFQSGFPFTAALPAGSQARDIQASPDGSSYIYVVEAPASGISMYGMETGIWDVSGVPRQQLTISGAGTLSSIRFTPDGQFAYVGDCDHGVWSLKHDSSTEMLTLLSSSPTPAGRGSCSLIVDPTGHFLFVANRDDSTLQAFQIDSSSGSLTQLGTATTGSQPRMGASDRSGRFLFVLNTFDNTISA